MQARKEISKEMPVKQVLKRIKQPLQLACYLHGFNGMCGGGDFSHAKFVDWFIWL